LPSAAGCAVEVAAGRVCAVQDFRRAEAVPRRARRVVARALGGHDGRRSGWRLQLGHSCGALVCIEMSLWKKRDKPDHRASSETARGETERNVGSNIADKMGFSKRKPQIAQV